MAQRSTTTRHGCLAQTLVFIGLWLVSITLASLILTPIAGSAGAGLATLVGTVIAAILTQHYAALDRSRSWLSKLRGREPDPVSTGYTIELRGATRHQTTRPIVNRMLNVVGESHHRDELIAVCGPRKENGVDLTMTATLVPEDDNPYDGNAVQVVIKGYAVGYLSRPDAVIYREKAHGKTQCQAHITGGWYRDEDDCGDFGVVLLDPPWLM